MPPEANGAGRINFSSLPYTSRPVKELMGTNPYSGKIQGMRRLVITVFALLYSAWTVSNSTNRTFIWANQVETQTHDSSVHIKAGKVAKPNAQLEQRRLLENHFLVAPPVAPHSEPLLPYARFHVQTQVWSSEPATRQVSSRAPPSIS
jgi:hypothetical protein